MVAGGGGRRGSPRQRTGYLSHCGNQELIRETRGLGEGSPEGPGSRTRGPRCGRVSRPHGCEASLGGSAWQDRVGLVRGQGTL